MKASAAVSLHDADRGACGEGQEHGALRAPPRAGASVSLSHPPILMGLADGAKWTIMDVSTKNQQEQISETFWVYLSLGAISAALTHLCWARRTSDWNLLEEFQIKSTEQDRIDSKHVG